MRAGPMNHRCIVQSQQKVPDGGGGFTQGWVELRKIWAEITMPTGRAAVVAQQIENLVSAEIRVRPASDLVAGLRIVDGTTVYLIEAALLNNERSMLRLLCSNIPHP